MTIKVVNENKLYKNFIKSNNHREKKVKSDPLSKYPMKLCAYSNELGAAISPINATLGNLLWAPALMYFGADIYDKYKNEDKTYNPDKKRCVKRAIFQALTSIILPTSVIKIGQKVGVHVAKGKNSLSPADKKELVEFSMNFLENSQYPKEDNSDFTDSLVGAFKQKVKTNQKRLQKKGMLTKFASLFVEPHGPEHTMARYLANPKEDSPIIEYLKAQGKIATDIMSDESKIQADRYKEFFKKAKMKYENVEIARKETVLKIFKEKNINKSLVAALSGLLALAIFIKPIDLLAEYFLMPKIISPLIDKFSMKNKEQN